MGKKLLIISDSFSLESGGIENTSYLLAEYMRQYMDVFTFCPKGGIKPDIEGVQSYSGTVDFENPRTRLEYLREAYSIIKTIHKKNHIDYILCTHFYYGFPAWILKKRFGIPYGVMTHGNEVYEKWKKHNTFYATLRWVILEYVKRQLLLNDATHIYSNTYFTQNLVKKISRNKSLVVINPPFGYISSEGGIVPSENKYIFSLGRLVERKGFQNVIKALPKVIESYPNLIYVLAGDGEYKETLTKLARELKVENHVIFKGRISENEKIGLFQNCEVFVMPSYNIPEQRSVEGFGISLIEANSYGKFVISTFSGGIPEAVDNNKSGFLVKENDVEELILAILRFFDPHFNYDTDYCKQWAQKRHISEIAKQYYEAISKSLKIK